jgi:hypothetical protein
MSKDAISDYLSLITNLFSEEINIENTSLYTELPNIIKRKRFYL